MTTSPVAGPAAFAVMPVVDYEPPAHDVPRAAARSLPSSHVPSLRRRRPHSPPPDASPAAAMSAPMRQAAMFADAALRRVLEVIDRRRPAAQLRPLLAPSLVDSVGSAGRCLTGQAPGQAAVLRRMRLQAAGHRDPDSAAEVFGSYSRGNRMHAIACRVERVLVGGEPRWQVVALHIG